MIIRRITDDRRRREIYQVTGDIDLAWAEQLYRAVLPAVDRPDPEPVLVDLAGVTFMDSTGLQALIDLWQAAHASGKDLVLIEPSERVERVIELAGLRGQLHQEPAEPDALPPCR